MAAVVPYLAVGQADAGGGEDAAAVHGEAGDFIRAAWREGDAVLLKGSRGVAVEKALERLLG